MTRFLNKLSFILLTILSNGINIYSIKAFDNSSERNDYFLDNISSNTLNERIANNLDKIEREIAVHIEHNDLRDPKNEYSVESNPNDDRLDEQNFDSEYQSNNTFDYYMPTNSFNAQNISEEQFEEIFKDSDSDKIIAKDANEDKPNKSWIKRRGSDERPVADLEAKPLNLVAKQSVSESAKAKETNIWSDNDFNHMAYQTVFPHTDRNLENLLSNVYKNNSIIAVETTNDRDIDSPNSLATNAINATNANNTTNSANTSNSLIDRIKLLAAKEENITSSVLVNEQDSIKVERTQPISSEGEGAQGEGDAVQECHKFVENIEPRVSGELLAVSLERWPNYVMHLCVYLSASNECNSSNSSGIPSAPSDLCKSVEDDSGKCSDVVCVNCDNCSLSLKTNHSGDNRKVNYLIGWYDCKDNTSHCQSFPIEFDNDKPDSGVRVVVIISATVVPIVCLAIIAIVCIWTKNKNKTAMKKFDCFGVKILKQMPHKSKSRKRRVDKMPTEATPGTAVINMEEVNQHKAISKSKSVKLDQFSQYYVRNRADSGLKLAEEYEELKEVTTKKQSMKISQFTINKSKNRFVNILPYDHSIVTLKLKNGVIGSDYINANFIAGFTNDKEYIASQGPLYSTVNDFFRMIIEYNIKIIVCLTQCIEKGRPRCEKYWPNNDDIDEVDEESSHASAPQITFDDITVELCDESFDNEFVVRELKLIKDGSQHFVTQYHFTEWPDFGCPQNPYSLIHLIEVIRTQIKTISEQTKDNSSVSPILVHCSAGVGRSGTFIAVDKIMQMLNENQNKVKDLSIDIFNTVYEMRKTRPHMVQTEDQYIFIYDCVKHLIDRFENKTTDNDLKCEAIESHATREIRDCDRLNEQISGQNSNDSNSSVGSLSNSGTEATERSEETPLKREVSLDESSENTDL